MRKRGDFPNRPFSVNSQLNSLNRTILEFKAYHNKENRREWLSLQVVAVAGARRRHHAIAPGSLFFLLVYVFFFLYFIFAKTAFQKRETAVFLRLVISCSSHRPPPGPSVAANKRVWPSATCRSVCAIASL